MHALGSRIKYLRVGRPKGVVGDDDLALATIQNKCTVLWDQELTG